MVFIFKSEEERKKSVDKRVKEEKPDTRKGGQEGKKEGRKLR